MKENWNRNENEKEYVSGHEVGTGLGMKRNRTGIATRIDTVKERGKAIRARNGEKIGTCNGNVNGNKND